MAEATWEAEAAMNVDGVRDMEFQFNEKRRDPMNGIAPLSPSHRHRITAVDAHHRHHPDHRSPAG